MALNWTMEVRMLAQIKITAPARLLSGTLMPLTTTVAELMSTQILSVSEDPKTNIDVTLLFRIDQLSFRLFPQEIESKTRPVVAWRLELLFLL